MSVEDPFIVRSFQPHDLAACRTLFVEGMLGGKLAEIDSALDINDIEAAYMKTPGSHFWVAELTAGPNQSQIVGMIGLIRPEPAGAEIRRLRVRRDNRRRGIGSALMEKALKFSHDMGYLKITLDTFIDRDPAVKLFEKFRFRHSRTRNKHGKDLLYFYLDLYTGAPAHDPDARNAADPSEPRQHIEPQQ